MKKVNMKCKIAGIVFDVDAYSNDFLQESLKNYCIDCADADYKVNLVLCQDKIPAGKGQKLTDVFEVNWYRVSDKVYECVYYSTEYDVIMVKIHYDMNESQITAYIYDMEKNCGADFKLAPYNIFGRIFKFAIIWQNGFVVHASSVIYNNEGVAFSAESGTGKSTHTALWLKNYDGTRILNDDCPAIRRIDGVWSICGTPWAGTTGINVNRIVPLKALVFLERSEDNQIYDCSAMEAVCKFFEAVIHPFSDEMTNMMMASLNSLLSESRVCSLGCNMEDEAAETVRKYLFDD